MAIFVLRNANVIDLHEAGLIEFLATLAGIYALLSLGLVTIWGQGGMVNLGLVGFYAVGAYASALLSQAGLPIGLTLIIGGLLAGGVGVVLSYATRPLRGDYLAIAAGVFCLVWLAAIPKDLDAARWLSDADRATI